MQKGERKDMPEKGGSRESASVLFRLFLWFVMFPFPVAEKP